MIEGKFSTSNLIYGVSSRVPLYCGDPDIGISSGIDGNWKAPALRCLGLASQPCSEGAKFLFLREHSTGASSSNLTHHTLSFRTLHFGPKFKVALFAIYPRLWAGTRRNFLSKLRGSMTESASMATASCSAMNGNAGPAVNGAKKKLHGRAFYESIGSPKFVLAPMVDQSEFVRNILSIWMDSRADSGTGLADAHPLLHTPILPPRPPSLHPHAPRPHVQRDVQIPL